MTDSALEPAMSPVTWNDSFGSVEKQFRFRQSFQSACPMSGRPCGPRFLSGGVEEQACDHDRLCLGAGDVARDLERLVRLGREAVQVQAVVPVGVPDERKADWNDCLNLN